MPYYAVETGLANPRSRCQALSFAAGDRRLGLRQCRRGDTEQYTFKSGRVVLLCRIHSEMTEEEFLRREQQRARQTTSS